VQTHRVWNGIDIKCPSRINNISHQACAEAEPDKLRPYRYDHELSCPFDILQDARRYDNKNTEILQTKAIIYKFFIKIVYKTS